MSPLPFPSQPHGRSCVFVCLSSFCGFGIAGGLTLGSPYVGELSEVNLWDRALPRLSVKQLAASRDKWKFPGNVMSWSQLADARSGAMEITTASHSAGKEGHD